MNKPILSRIVESSIMTATAERSHSHAVLPVTRAVALAMETAQAAESDRLHICHLVCEQGIRRGLVLQFGTE
jgi:dihydroorotase-like cyclic amidohydrolase